jgi:hypothetical protein
MSMLRGRKKGLEEDNVEEPEDNGRGLDLDMKDQTEELEANDIVDLSGDEGDRNAESDSSLSINTKINNVQTGKSPNHSKKKHKGAGIPEEIEEANENRFSNRLASMSDIPIMGRAIIRAMVKNLQPLEGTSVPTLASTYDYCILDIASRVGIELGTSLDMIDNNLSLLRGQEQARVNIFINSEKNNDCQESSLDVDNQPDGVDQALMVILKMAK